MRLFPEIWICVGRGGDVHISSSFYDQMSKEEHPHQHQEVSVNIQIKLKWTKCTLRICFRLLRLVLFFHTYYVATETPLTHLKPWAIQITTVLFLILKLFFFQPKTSLSVVWGRHVRRLLRLGELWALKQVCKR